NVPAMAAPGDEFVVSVGVFNNSMGNGPIRLDIQLSPGLTLKSVGSVQMQVAERKEGVGEFRVKADAPLGSATLTFTARRAPGEARIDETVSIRPAVPYRTQLALGRLDRSAAAVPLTRNLYSERRKVEAAVSVLPLVWGQGLTDYLNEYPYLCSEQL